MSGLTSCPLCGRSGGHILRGREVCSRCLAEIEPTPLQLWRAAIGLTVAEIAEGAGLVPFTVQRALRGERLGAEAVAKLCVFTGLGPEEIAR